MYQDVRGLVTVAVGNKVDPVGDALELPFVKLDGSPASRDDIALAWHTVKDAPNLAVAGYLAAEHMTEVRLTDAAIDALVLRRMDQMNAVIVMRWPEFETFPAKAQLVILSMSWAAGPNFWAPKFSSHVLARDWASAATECGLHTARDSVDYDLLVAASRVDDDVDSISLSLQPLGP